MQTSGPIVIAGFMACGKTALARTLAARLDCKMIDLDEEITERQGRPPANLIEEDGESAFRKIETDTLEDVLRNTSVGVIALGGGAWINEASRALINQYARFTVWLDTPFDVCWERISLSNTVRPLGRSEELARKLYELRRPIYELADVRLIAGKEAGLDELARQIEGHEPDPTSI